MKHKEKIEKLEALIYNDNVSESVKNNAIKQIKKLNSELTTGIIKPVKKTKGLKALLKDEPKKGSKIPDTDKLLEKMKGKKATKKTASVTKTKSILEIAKEKNKSRKRPATKKSAPKPKKEKDWKLIALKELRKQEGNKNLVKAHYGESDDYFEVTSDSAEYKVFKTETDARHHAEDYVKDMLEDEPSTFSDDFLKQHMYVSDTDKRIIAGEQGDFYVYDIKDSEPERIIEEAGMEDEYNEEEDDSKKEEILERAADKLKSDIYDRWYEGLDKDPVYFLTEEEGLYSREDLDKITFLQIDTSEASKAAVQEDGVAHFLAQYDGNEIDLPGGYVAYRTN